MQIQCESPAIILNPHLKELVLKYRHYYLRGFRHAVTPWQSSRWFEEFPYSMFGHIKRQIQSSDELSSYYVIDENDEEVPLFHQVPCGKCVLCREHKAQEWVTRAMCETQTSSSYAYFVTLTYNDLHCPANGVRKRAVQLFMKRLRINISRYVGEVVNIRFYCCSEYGSKSGRPHYHAILWNVPYLDPSLAIHLVMLQNLIQRSWSFMVSKKRYDELPSTLDKYGEAVYKYYDEDTHRYRGLYGYTTCSLCNEKRVRYCMKYMRKESQVPVGCNDIFFLSSRKRGIGYQWISEHVAEFRSNPQFMDIQLTDKYTGESFSGCIPRYFKDIIAPPPSRLLTKEIRGLWSYYNWLHNKACSLIGHLYEPSVRLLRHFPTLYYHSTRLSSIATEELMLYPQLKDYDCYQSYTRELFRICDKIEWALLQFEYDIDLALYVPEYKRKHLAAVEQLAKNDVTSVADKAVAIRRRWQRAKQHERF